MLLLVYRRGGGGRIWLLLCHLSIIWYSKKISNPAYHVQLVERIIFKKNCPKRTFRSDFVFWGLILFKLPNLFTNFN